MNYYTAPFHVLEAELISIIENNKNDFARTFGDVDVDYDYFRYLSNIGKAFVCVMGDEKIIGVSGFIIQDVANNNDVEADNVMFFVDKEYRGRHTKKFLEFCRKEMSKKGANKASFTVKSDVLGRLLKMNGFNPAYTTWEHDL